MENPESLRLQMRSEYRVSIVIRTVSSAYLKNILKPHPERLREAKRKKQRRKILARLERHDGVPGYACHLRNLILGHFSMLEPQSADMIYYGALFKH
jgi:hypothetical protein